MQNDKFILGSGIVGLLAREILGSEWTLIPHGKSRYFWFEPPFADNYIAIDTGIDDYWVKSTGLDFKRAFSVNGELSFFPHDAYIDAFVDRVFGADPQHPFAKELIKTNLIFKVSTDTAKSVYTRLYSKYKNEIIKSATEFGNTDKIENGQLTTTTGLQLPYTQILSTIPLNSLLNTIPAECAIDLQAKTVWYYHILTADLDFEGADQVLVVDDSIDFYKVNNIDRYGYVFSCLNEIKTPEAYFKFFMNEFIVKNQSKITDALPVGVPPNLKWLQDDHNIKCVGSNAEWDDFIDVGTCIRRILRYKDGQVVRSN